MKKFFSDFKKFIVRGNILDLAVAVIIGGAFGRIVTSLVNDVIMPLVSLMVGGRSVSDWKWVITPEVRDATGVIITTETALMYGHFIQTIIDFLIIAICIFLIIKLIMHLNKDLYYVQHELTARHNKEQRQLIKTLKAEKKSKKEIKIALKTFDDQKLAELEEAEIARKAEAELNRSRTSEELLAEIVELLKKDQLK